MNGSDSAQLREKIRQLEAQLARYSPNGQEPAHLSPTTDVADILLRTTRTACFCWRNDGRGTLYSANAAETLGYPPQESNQDFIRTHIIEHDRQRISQAFKNCILSGKGYSAELQLISRDGNRTWHQVRVKVLERTTDGQASYMVGSVADIDGIKREQLEQASIARTELWLRHTLRQLLEDDSWENIERTLQCIGDFFKVDRCALWLIGSEKKIFTLTCWWAKPGTEQDDLFTQSRIADFPKLQQHLSGNTPYVFQRSESAITDPGLLVKLKQLDVVSSVIIPVHYQNQLDGILSLGSLKSERHWSERQLEAAQIIADTLARSAARNRMTCTLKENDKRYSDALEATRDGLWDLDLSDNTLHCSKRYLDMLGYEEGELGPLTYQIYLDVLMYPDDVRYIHNVVKQALLQKESIIQCEFRMLHKSGRIVWVYSRAKYVDFDSQGNPARCIGVNADITQFKQAQADLLQAKSEAIAANQTKNEFLTRMSHEIRTPMNAIIGMGHLLEDTSLSQQQRDYLSSINESAAELLHIINEILDFSKLESGKYLLENAHFNLDQIYEQLSDGICNKADEKNIEVIFDIDHDVPHFIKGDARRLHQILHNFLDNALKFTEQGEIVMRTRKKSQHNQQVELEFSVTDTGIGIDKNTLQYLFDPFAQADGSSSRRFGGTGLGLTICKYLVDQMGGDIQVNSQEGVGSSFTFTATFDRSQLGEQPVRHEPQRYHHLRTLIVDDYPNALAVLKKTAISLQLKVETAGSAKEALALLADNQNDDTLNNSGLNNPTKKTFELVLIDFKMPHINGLEACQLIRDDPKILHKPKTILISNYSRHDISEQLPMDDIDGFINKPVTPSRMFDAIALTFGESLFELPDSQPAHQLQRQPQVPLSNSEQDNRLNNARVLLAEDNLVNQKVAIGMLKKKGVQVTVAHNGQQAIDQLNANDCGHFDAILMDMEMPELDGYQATRQIRAGKHCTNIPIIAMTAHALQGDREHCIQAGMNDYITKPVKPQLLYQVLAHYLTSTQQLQ